MPKKEPTRENKEKAVQPSPPFGLHGQRTAFSEISHIMYSNKLKSQCLETIQRGGIYEERKAMVQLGRFFLVL